MNTFKEKYSKEELKEIADWFRERMDKLPMELRINECTKTRNLPYGVKRILALIDRPVLGVDFSGYIAHLFIIREHLKAAGME